MGSVDCAHDVVFCGLCALCGLDVGASGAAVAASGFNPLFPSSRSRNGKPGIAASQYGTESSLRRRPGLLTAAGGISVSVGELARIEEAERQRRLGARRLVLVLDIDHTLLQTGTKQQVDALGLARPDQHVSALDGFAGPQLFIRIRPQLPEFLRQAHELCETYLYTHGTRLYAHAVVEKLDPGGFFFGDPPRLFHRENTPHGLKNLSEIFPADKSLVLIVDDRDEVWPWDVRRSHVIKVSPYLFFGNDARTGNSLEGFVDAWQPRGGLSPACRSGPHGREVVGSPATKRQRVTVGCGGQVNSTGIGDTTATTFMNGTTCLDAVASGGRAESARGNGGDNLNITGDIEDLDTQLPFLLRILRRIHRATLGPLDCSNRHGSCVGNMGGGDTGNITSGSRQIGTESASVVVADVNVGATAPHIAMVVPALRGRTLQDCVVCVTGITVQGKSIQREPIAWWCIQLGASIEDNLSSKTTHLVAVRRDTEKYSQALQRRAEGANIHLVHPGWILRAIATWQRPAEDMFAVPPNGDWPYFLDIWSASGELPLLLSDASAKDEVEDLAADMEAIAAMSCVPTSEGRPTTHNTALLETSLVGPSGFVDAQNSAADETPGLELHNLEDHLLEDLISPD